MPRAKAKVQTATKAEMDELCDEIRKVQRERTIVIKSKVMQTNRLQAVIAGTLGYQSNMEEHARKDIFEKARRLIEAIMSGKESHPYEHIVKVTQVGIIAFESLKDDLDKTMRRIAARLPVAEWVEGGERKGFGLLSLGAVVGECGNLSNYANPGKVWRRMGCAPWEFAGHVRMGSTWRKLQKSGKGLPDEEWSKFGYSPRRRSVAYIIGEGLIRQNGHGPYRKRWLEAKLAALEAHPEWNWSRCDKCKDGQNGHICETCGGSKVKCQQAHLHGMLLATKMLFRDLWVEWTQKTAIPKYRPHYRNGTT